MGKPDPENLSGRLRHRVTLIDPASRPDRNDLGETIDAGRATQVNVPAFVKTLSGRELVYAQQVVAEVTTVVEVRYRVDYDRFKKLLYDGRTLNIDAAIDPDELKVRLFLYCREDA